MTYHLQRRATALPLQVKSPDPYWRKVQSYRQALAQLHVDAVDNYKGGEQGPRPERMLLIDMLAHAVLRCDELTIEFETRNLFSDGRATHEAMFVLPHCYPYAARHYANIVEDMRDFAVSSLVAPTVENTQGDGSLPALLTELTRTLHEMSPWERRPPVDMTTPTRVATEHTGFDNATMGRK